MTRTLFATLLAAEPATNQTEELARFAKIRYDMFVGVGMPPFTGGMALLRRPDRKQNNPHFNRR